MSENKEGPKVTETLKKLLAAGLSGAALSEEILKNYLAEAKLPKELFQPLVQGLSKSRDELTQKVIQEVARQLEKVDWAKEMGRFLEEHKLNIKMEISVKKNSPSKMTRDSST
jgi:hypothetical protein